jgi:hypothetical protein
MRLDLEPKLERSSSNGLKFGTTANVVTRAWASCHRRCSRQSISLCSKPPQNLDFSVLKLLHTGAADTNYGLGGNGFSSPAEFGPPSGTILYPTSIALDSANQAFIAGSTCPTCAGTPADRLFVAKITVGGNNYGGFGINDSGYAEYTSCQNAGTQTNVSGSVQITTRSNDEAILFANGAANSLPGSGADFCAINLNNVGAETARRTHDMYGQNDQFLDLDTSVNAAGSVSIAGLSTSSVNRYFVADVNR